jgi:Bacterial Ig-like domain (group 3)
VLINNTAVVIQTTTTLASALNPSNYGQSVTFTAAVSSAKGTPTGTVIFYNGSNVLGSVMLADGGASFSISSLSAGTHSITAAYQRSGNFAPSTAVLKQVVNGNGPFPTKTKLATSGSPSSAGQSVTFTAAVTSANGATPNGDLVTFYDGSVELGTGITALGVATFTTSSLTPGKHTIKATYAGGGRFEASTGTIAQVVGKYTTTTTLAGNPNPAAYGQPVTYTATVTSTGPTTPTGHVKFTSLGLAPLIGGVATYTKKLVLAGTHLITAEYEGDDVSAPSTSAVLEELVNPALTTTVLTSSVNPSSSGQSVTFTATVTSSTGLDSFGSVTFTAGSTALGTVELSGTVAYISTATLPVGSTKITATYSGAKGFTGSSKSLTQKVSP